MLDKPPYKILDVMELIDRFERREREFKIIKQSEFSPVKYELLEVDAYLKPLVSMKEGEILVIDRPPQRKVHDTYTLARNIVESGLDYVHFAFIIRGYVDTYDLAEAQLFLKCYTYGDRVQDNNTLNFLGESHAGHDPTLWRNQHIRDVILGISEHLDVLGKPHKDEPVTKCPKVFKDHMMIRMRMENVSPIEKYARMTVFNYIAEGLRLEGYNIAPIKMPKHLEEMVQEKVQTEHDPKKIPKDSLPPRKEWTGPNEMQVQFGCKGSARKLGRSAGQQDDGEGRR